MKSILEQLYIGNIGFDSARYPQGSPFTQAAQRKLENMEKLKATLNDSQKALFENYCEAQGDIEGIVRYDTFIATLKFGVMFMTEILTDNGKSKQGY